MRAHTPTHACTHNKHTHTQHTNTHTLRAGGYDHTVKLWDVRAGGGSSGGCSMSLDHGAPVEDLAFFPSGGLLATAGGTSVCIWDVLR